MGSNRSLLEFRFSLSQLSPHAADLTRRQLLRAGGRLAAVAAALLAGRFGPMPAVAAESVSDAWIATPTRNDLRRVALLPSSNSSPRTISGRTPG